MNIVKASNTLSVDRSAFESDKQSDYRYVRNRITSEAERILEECGEIFNQCNSFFI